jgi:hypothetical protein
MRISPTQSQLPVAGVIMLREMVGASQSRFCCCLSNNFDGCTR